MSLSKKPKSLHNFILTAHFHNIDNIDKMTENIKHYILFVILTVKLTVKLTMKLRCYFPIKDDELYQTECI